jgi:hypothetical protein
MRADATKLRLESLFTTGHVDGLQASFLNHLTSMQHGSNQGNKQYELTTILSWLQAE